MAAGSRWVVAVAALWMAAALAARAAAEGPQQHSGYLGGTSVYERLAPVELRSGVAAWRWVGPEFSATYYDAVIVEDVVFYPEARPGPRVSAATLREVKAFLSADLRAKVAAVVASVREPGTNVLRMQTAVTGVGKVQAAVQSGGTPALAPLFGGSPGSGEGGTGRARVFVEVRFHDSRTGQVVGLAMRELDPRHVDGSKAELLPGDLRPALEQVTGDAAASLGAMLRDSAAPIR